MNFIKKFNALDAERKKNIIILLVVMIVIVASLIIFVQNAVRISVYNERKSSLSDTVSASAITVNTAIKDNRKTADIFYNIVSDDLTAFDTVDDFIIDTKAKMLTGNDMFFLVDNNGRYFSSDGKSGVLSDLSYFASTTEEEYEYFSTLPHLNPNTTYFILRHRLDTPITINSEKGTVEIRYCAMMFDLQQLNETISSLFAGANNTFIYESGTGAMLYKQFNIGMLVEGYNIYPKWKKGVLPFGETADEMINTCRNREICVAQFELDGMNYYICSAPIDVSDWSLMFVVQQKYIHEAAGNGLRKIIYLITAIIMLLGLFVLLCISLTWGNRVRSEKEKTQVVINALSEDFESVMFVPYTEDKRMDKAVHYRKSKKLARNIPHINEELTFSKMLDVICDDIQSDSDKEIFLDSTRREIIMKKISNKSSYFVNFKLLIDGKDEYSQIQFSPVLDKTEKNIGFVAGIRSVDKETREKMAVREKLEQALEEANYASQAKSTFLFNMSHDIRTPMNAILGFTRMALRDIDVKEKVSENLKKIQVSGDMLLSLINDILEMSRIESGKITISDNKGDITKSFDGITPVMNDLAAAKNISINYSVINIRDRYIHLDKVRVQRILMNLISNAIKYTNNGGWVKVTCAQLDEEHEGYGVYRFTVEDNGIGMSEEFLKHLFEEFTREETATTSGIQGTGLGLALVKSLTDLMGGTVSVRSKLNVGSEFTVDIPFKRQDAEEIEQNKEDVEKKEENVHDLSGKNVLLVEDNAMNREIAADVLREAGMMVSMAENGAEAVDALQKKGPEAYDIVLMDIQMPVMDGYEASKTIRSLWPDKKIVIIALSANAFEEDKRRSIDSGMNDHIAKPINAEDLFHTIRKYL